MKKTKLLTLLMAMVMMAMNPTKVWADDLTPLTEEKCTELGLAASYVDYYAIGNANDLAWFRDFVNASAVVEETTTYPNQSAKAVLTADIDLSTLSGNWIPIGTGATYTGTFDGQGHSITGMSILNYTTGNQGFFGTTGEGSNIKNFTLSGEMTSSTSGLSNIGSVVAAAGYKTGISDVTSNVTITLTEGTTQNYIAGIAGGRTSRTTLTRCVNNGNINAGASTNCIAGMMSFVGGYGSTNYCLNTGNITTTGNNAYIAGMVAYQNDDQSRFNGSHQCLNTGKITAGSDKYAGAIYGWYRHHANQVGDNNYYLSTSATKAVGENSTTDDLTGVCTSLTADQITSGEACYLLNGSTSSGTLNWYQTLNSDNTPLPYNTHKVVVYNGTKYINALAAGTCGDCTWVIDMDGSLVIRPTTGESGTLANWSGDSSPWKTNNAADIKTVSFQGTVNAGTSIRGMFASCPNLTSIDFTNFNTANVTNMQNLTNGSKKLKTINFGSTFSTANVANMKYMFKNCEKLQSLDLSGFTSEKLTSTIQMFHSCSALTSLTFGENFTCASVTDMSNMFYNVGANLGSEKGPENSITLDLSHFNTANVTTMAAMFQNCKAKAIILSPSFSTAKVTTMNQMFRECIYLQSLDLSNFNTENVTDMSYMFYYCPEITSLNVSSFNTANVTDMQGMFADCDKLPSLNLSSFNTANVTNMKAMFYGCDILTSLTLGNFDMQAVTDYSILLYIHLKNLTLKALPFLKDQTFNSRFTGNDITVNYELDDNSVIYTGTNYLPAATTAPTYTRTIAADSNWGTVVVPFEAKSDDEVQLYALTAVDNDNITLTPVATVAANTPCIFKKKVANATSVTFTANSAEVVNAVPVTLDAVDGLTLTGTYTAADVETGAGYMLDADKYVMTTAKTTLSPFRAYLAGSIDGVSTLNPQAAITSGDLNADGNITIADLTLLVEILNSNGTITNSAADVDGDGNITLDDVNALRDKILETK